ncbi:MAG: sulfatase-like hydrolase/transferase, partial [Bacilli bacterium]|nr:sulfatase-like hydrolase/transferase [Bacilli bacterium]
MNRLKVKIKRLYTKTKRQVKRIKKEHLIREYFKDNMFFYAYVIVNVLNATILRFFCIHSLENYLSIRAVISDAMIVILIGAFGYLLKPKSRPGYYIGFSVLFVAICMINSIYYTFYSSFASLSMLELMQYVGQVGDAVVKNVLQPKDLIYLVGFIFLIVIWKKLSKKSYFKRVEVKSVRRRKMFTTLSMAGILAIIFFLTMKPLDVTRFVKQWNKEYIVMRFGIYIYQGEDIVTSLQPKINSMFGYDQAKKNFDEYFKDKPDTNTNKNKYTDIFKGKNILVIHAESMMTNAMSLKFNGQEVTPYLNKMANEGMFFDNFYSQVSVGTSSDSELTNTTSLMP